MGKYKAYTPEPEGNLEIDGVPTTAGLMKKGREYAYKRPDGRIHITEEGHALLGQKLRERAQRDEGKWHGATGVHDSVPPQPGIPR
jgi:hypothetical protein